MAYVELQELELTYLYYSVKIMHSKLYLGACQMMGPSFQSKPPLGNQSRDHSSLYIFCGFKKN